MDEELPDYSAAPSSPAVGSSSNVSQTGSQHISSLQDSKGSKWLTLTVNSRSPTSTSLPVVYEGDAISGQVDFEMLKSDSIKGVSIKVCIVHDVFITLSPYESTRSQQGRPSSAKRNNPSSMQRLIYGHPLCPCQMGRT